MQHIDFSYSAYEELLKVSKKQSDPITFSEALTTNVSAQVTLLRHDIDLCLLKALDMARLENSNAVRSTYFIMTKNPLYSLEEIEFQKVLREIECLGHEIGLHFDPRQCAKEKIESSCAMLELDYLAN